VGRSGRRPGGPRNAGSIEWSNEQEWTLARNFGQRNDLIIRWPRGAEGGAMTSWGADQRTGSRSRWRARLNRPGRSRAARYSSPRQPPAGLSRAQDPDPDAPLAASRPRPVHGMAVGRGRVMRPNSGRLMCPARKCLWHHYASRGRRHRLDRDGYLFLSEGAGPKSARRSQHERHNSPASIFAESDQDRRAFRMRKSSRIGASSAHAPAARRCRWKRFSRPARSTF